MLQGAQICDGVEQDEALEFGERYKPAMRGENEKLKAKFLKVTKEYEIDSICEPPAGEE